MSGTSADGIDAVLLELPGFPPCWSAPSPLVLLGAAPRGKVLAHEFTPYTDALREQVFEASRDALPPSRLAQLHFRLGRAYAAAAANLAPQADIIACHGQTVQHIPRLDAGRGWTERATLQLGEAATIAEATGKPVISDFRPADLAAGGQAAPLVPWADWVLFAQDGVRRAVHNLGGISNLTFLPGSDATGVLAFDTGPANALIDELVARHGLRLDEGGRLALGGQVHQSLVESWLGDAFLRLPPPKSTGREEWTLARLSGLQGLEFADALATVTAFSAASVVAAYREFVLPRGLDEVIVAGGGAHNVAFMNHLIRGLDPIPVSLISDPPFAWNAAWREAAAFALLGYAFTRQIVNTLPNATGARHAVIAGKLTLPTPH